MNEQSKEQHILAIFRQFEQSEAGKDTLATVCYTLRDGTMYSKALVDGEELLLLVVPKLMPRQILYASHEERISGHLDKLTTKSANSTTGHDYFHMFVNM